MKKLIALIAALAMIILTVSAFAETPVRMMYDSAFNLLFDTSNVTLTGHAEFSLDGEHFKTANARYIQDGANSLLEWKLLTPRKDGTEREGGYTVIANGENVYVMEVFYPGVYKTGSTTESNTIMRKSIQLNLLRDLLRILSDQADTLLGKDAVTVQSDKAGMTVHIHTGKDVPELVNTALNMTAQFVAKRYFGTDYDHISERFMGPMENYITVTQAILGSTCYMSLNQSDITMKRDADGHFESAEGKVAIELSTGDDGMRMLDISFRLDASDFGGSKVAVFNPDDYGVKPVNGNMAGQELPLPDPEKEKMILEAAASRWTLAGYPFDDTMKGSVRVDSTVPGQGDGRIYIDFVNEDESAHWAYFTDSFGRLLGLHNTTNNWQNRYEDWHSEEYPDRKLVKETEEKILSWLAGENPELGADDLSLKNDWWYQTGDDLYLHFWEGGEPVSHAWDEVDCIVRVRPEWRIEWFSCIANG